LIQCLCSLLFNLPSLPSLLERSICGVDGDSDLVIEDDDLGGFREFRESAVCGGFVDDWGQDRVNVKGHLGWCLVSIEGLFY